MPKNDTRRIRGRLADLVTDAVYANLAEDNVTVLTTGQSWRPKTDQVGIAVAFTGVKQHTVTLSGAGVTLEDGVCVAQVVIPESHDCGENSRFDECYRFAQAITASVTVGDRITITEVASLTLNDPQATTSTITITGQPTIVPVYEWRGNTHLPIQIPYEAQTEDGT